MSYRDMSTRESTLAAHLEKVIAAHCPNPKLFCGACSSAREVLDAKCGAELAKTEKGWASAPCQLPAGHSGACNAG
jgi:hypothetical protein